MALIHISGPADEPVTLAQAKMQCRVVTNDEDALFSAIYIPAAREAAEHRLGRLLVDQTKELVIDRFPAGEIDLQLPDVSAIVSVKYLDTAGDEQTMDPAAYSLETDPGRSWLHPAYGTDWPDTIDTVNAVRVRFTAGYGASADGIPSGIKAWIMLAIGSLYEHREALSQGHVAELPGGFWDRLLDPYRIWRV